MKRATRSLRFAVEGLVHAFLHERNLRMFVLLHIFIVLGSIVLLRSFDVPFFVMTTFAAGFFIVVELLNTAIERLADTFDDCEKKSKGGHYHPGVKMTKDVGAAASLVALVLYGVCVIIVALATVMVKSLETMS